MATTMTKNNQLIDKIKSDGLFGGGVQGDMRAAMDSTYSNLRAPTSVPQQDTPFTGGMNAPAAGTNTLAPVNPANVAAGNIFGVGMPTGERNAIATASAPEQLAGYISGTEDQGRIAMFQEKLAQSGFNLNPVGQLPEEYQGALQGARNVYNSIFATPGQAPSSPSSTNQFFAPSGLRGSALDAGGNPVISPTGAIVTGTPGQMTGDDGRALPLGQQRGANFTLRQNPFAVAAAQTQTQTAPQRTAGAMPTTPTAYDKNLSAFKDHLIAQQMQAGLMKGIPPGYMLDPDKPNAIKPIPGGPAEAKVREDALAASEKQAAQTEKVRQVVETSNNVVGSINDIMPKIDNLTAGPIGGVAQHLPGTPGYNVGVLLKGIKANLGVQQLQSMREASKTGASGFGQLSEKELDVLTSTVANLDQAQDPEQLKKGLSAVRDHFNAWKLSYEAGQKAAQGTLSPSDQAKAILAIRQAAK